jgi:CubicO group peptidase (beta-lactamase class C family)
LTIERYAFGIGPGAYRFFVLPTHIRQDVIVNRVTLSLSFAAAALLAPPLVAQTTSPCAGHWNGSIELPGTALAFDVDFSEAGGVCKGDISIPAQNARNVALENVVMRSDSARFTIVGIPGAPTFAGVRSADGRTVSGIFTQGPGKFPFRMSAGQPASELARTALAGFDAWVDSAMTAWKVVGLSIGITVDGQTVYLKGHGLRDQAKKLPVTPQTLFAIGSSSKAFTTFAMGTLVDQGKLQWDVPVRTYLPWFRMNTEFATMHLTPRDLVTHRSGLPRHDALWYNNTTDTRESLVRRLAYLPLNKDLRETFQYNNLMFLTAGYLVGNLTGNAWEDGIRQLVLTPLGMSRTNFSVKASEADPDHALPYLVRHVSIHVMPFRDINLVGPAGSINSSAEEMLKWVGLHLAGGKLGGTQVIQSATLLDMYRPYTPITGMGDNPELGPMSYGMGWFVDTYRGHYRAQHGGNIDGFTAAVTLLPQDRIGMVVLVNQNGAALGELVSRHAMDRLFGGTRRDWSTELLARRRAADAAERSDAKKAGEARVPNAPPSRKLAEYVGVYSDSGYGPITISLERDTLSVAYNGIGAKLQPWHFETFRALRNPVDPALEGTMATFRSSAAGEVNTIEVTMEPLVPPISFTRMPDARLLDAAYLQRFVGRYQIPGGPVAAISLRGNELVWAQGPGGVTKLLPRRGTKFMIAGQDISVEFREDATGKITGARVVQSGVVADLPRLP